MQALLGSRRARRVAVDEHDAEHEDDDGDRDEDPEPGDVGLHQKDRGHEHTARNNEPEQHGENPVLAAESPRRLRTARGELAGLVAELRVKVGAQLRLVIDVLVGAPPALGLFAEAIERLPILELGCGCAGQLASLARDAGSRSSCEVAMSMVNWPSTRLPT